MAISFTNEDYFYSGCDKQIKITSSGGAIIDNTMLYSEEFELDESLCSEDQLAFGACEAATLKFRFSGAIPSLVGQTLTVSVTLNDDLANVLTIGKYKVVSDKPNADRTYRDVEAYDALYEILNTDVAAWYKTLTFPMTLKNFRDSFFTHVGVTQETTTLVNDNMAVAETLDVQILSGATVIKSICQINGCFGHINRNGNFEYKTLSAIGDTGFNDAFRINLDYEDYVCPAIDKLIIRKEENDVGVTVGSGDNPYVVQGNFLVYDYGTVALTAVANALYAVVNVPVYRPAEMAAVGNPCIEVGDGYKTVGANNTTVKSYVFTRSLRGIQAMKDIYTSSGYETRNENINSIDDKLLQINGKANILARTLEETVSEIYDEHGNSRIAQAATGFELTASNGTDSSTLTLKVTKEDGSTFNVTSNAISFSGMVTFANLSTAGQTVINGSNITTGTIDADLVDVINVSTSKLTVKDSDDRVIFSADAESRSCTMAGFSTTYRSLYTGEHSSVDSTKTGVFVGNAGFSVGCTYTSGGATKYQGFKVDSMGRCEAQCLYFGDLSIVQSDGSTPRNSDCIYTGQKYFPNQNTSGIYVGENGIGVGYYSNETPFLVSDQGYATIHYADIGGFSVNKTSIYTGSNSSSFSGTGLRFTSSVFGYQDGSYARTWLDYAGLHSKGRYTSELLIKATDSASSSCGEIEYGGNDRMTFNATGVRVVGSVVIGSSASSTRLAFFNDSNPSSSVGSTKQTVNKLSSSATLANTITKVNDLLTALKNYGLIAST